MAGPERPAITGEEVVRRATEGAPALAVRAAATDALRRLPDETMAECHDAGFFRVLQPARWGGLELPPSVLFDLQIALASACPSTGWVVGVIAVHAWQLALFPEEAQQEVWGRDPTTLISSSYAPTGRVERAPGGYRVSGRWSFSSGCDHCAWVFLGGFVPTDGPDARPDMRTFLLPRSDYRIDDNWHVSGLKGTGSKDIVVDGAFVPEHRTHRLIDGFKLHSPGNEVNPSPIYRLPFGQIHVRSVSSPALGAALGALHAYRERTRTRLAATDQSKVAEDPVSQVVCAEAAAEVDAARAVLHRNLDEMLALARAGQPIPVERRVQFRYESAAAAVAAARVVDRLFTASGGRAIFLDSPIQRFFQDVHAIRAHYANNPEPPGRNFGRVQLEMKNQDFFV